jgi:hypothetical protein
VDRHSGVLSGRGPGGEPGARALASVPTNEA